MLNCFDGKQKKHRSLLAWDMSNLIWEVSYLCSPRKLELINRWFSESDESIYFFWCLISAIRLIVFSVLKLSKLLYFHIWIIYSSVQKYCIKNFSNILITNTWKIFAKNPEICRYEPKNHQNMKQICAEIIHYVVLTVYAVSVSWNVVSWNMRCWKFLTW